MTPLLTVLLASRLLAVRCSRMQAEGIGAVRRTSSISNSRGLVRLKYVSRPSAVVDQQPVL
jgi:hypothetical protein